MIKLPRFTFLCGPPGSGQVDLIKALCAEDDSLLRMDFTASVQDMVAGLFPDSFPIVLDPLGEHADKSIMGFDIKAIPNDEFIALSSVTVKQTFYALAEALRELFGPRALGLMALKTYRNNGSDLVFERIIFSDTSSIEDIEVFTNTYGKESCLAIHLGDLSQQHLTTKANCHHIWLAEPSLKRRLQELELETTRERSKAIHTVGVFDEGR